MSPHRTRAIALRIIHGMRRDRRSLALLFVVPLVILALLGYLLRGGTTNAAVDVVDQDTGPIGHAVAQQLLFSTAVAARPTSLDEARDDMEHGRIAGYVVLPSDFSARATRDHEIAPQVTLEGTQPSLNGAVMGSLGTAMQKALTQIAGPAAPRIAVQTTFVHGSADLDTLDYFGAAFIGLVVFFLVYVLTSVAFLRERSQGTLERLMASPLRRGEIVVGYMVGFGVLALVQSALVLGFSLYVLHIYNAGPAWLVFVFDALLALGAVNLGIFFSAFARNEFQAVQFIPLVIVPQVLLSGIVFPVGSEPGVLQPVSNVLPLTYAVYGMRAVMLEGKGLVDAGVQVDLGVGLLFVVVAIVLGVLTLRRAAA